MTKRTEITCPGCRKKVNWENNKWRPFCSRRCKMIDLGKWASEDYKVSDKLSVDSDYNSSGYERGNS